ncbi:MAG: hypothetical protein QOK15_1452 [Nocardioidaceae bacterium]|nr:hypothetical protein [Nocardioidaceae bacterium]
MSSVQSRPPYESSRRGVPAGVARFAGILLAVVSVFEILEGIAAIANDSVFLRGLNYTYEFDVTVWGWIHLLLGVAGVAIGYAIVTDHTVGYLAGIAIAFVGAVANFAFLPYYPVWSLLVISFDVLVIWALCSQIAHHRVDEDYYAQPSASSGSTTTTAPAVPAEPSARR